MKVTNYYVGGPNGALGTFLIDPSKEFYNLTPPEPPAPPAPEPETIYNPPPVIYYDFDTGEPVYVNNNAVDWGGN